MARAAFYLAIWIPACFCAQGQTGGNQGPTVVINGLNLPSAITSDSQGNLYIVDEGCGIPAGQGDCNVYKEAVSGGAYTRSLVAAFTSANLPTSIAADAGGNVYVGVNGKGLYKETPAGSAYTQSSIGCAFAKPTALAFDGKEGFFVADSATGRLYREKAGDTCAMVTVVGNLTNVTGVAVDRCGNVYVAQSAGEASILKETPSNGGYIQSAVGSGMAGMIGVAVDGHGDVYYSDVMGSVSVWVPHGHEYTQHPVMKGLPLSPIGGMAIDGANNLYFADFTNSRIWKIAPAFALPEPPPCEDAPTSPANPKGAVQPK
jgi:serine/threonine protein kinase, bacterial